MKTLGVFLGTICGVICGVICGLVVGAAATPFVLLGFAGGVLWILVKFGWTLGVKAALRTMKAAAEGATK